MLRVNHVQCNVLQVLCSCSCTHTFMYMYSTRNTYTCTLAVKCLQIHVDSCTVLVQVTYFCTCDVHIFSCPPAVTNQGLNELQIAFICREMLKVSSFILLVYCMCTVCFSGKLLSVYTRHLTHVHVYSVRLSVQATVSVLQFIA